MEIEVTYSELPESKIIPLEMAKKNAKIDYDDEDDLFEIYIKSIGNEIENYTGRIFTKKEVEINLKSWKSKIAIPVTGILNITSIEFVSVSGDVVEVSIDDYVLHSYRSGAENYLLFKFIDFPELDQSEDFPIRIKGFAGYENDTIPWDVQRAALLMFNNAEAYREDMPISNNRSAMAVLRPYKLI